MAADCIHGFSLTQCAACRTCRHGFMTSRCSRCREDAGRKLVREPQPTEEYEGYEIYFVAAQNSWYYRAPEAVSSAESFRSAFLARRAVDRLLTAPAKVTAGGKRRR